MKKVGFAFDPDQRDRNAPWLRCCPVCFGKRVDVSLNFEGEKRVKMQRVSAKCISAVYFAVSF